eukprot:scaffold38947_cov52-Prasinocladus_malaysianus.AAC.1
MMHLIFGCWYVPRLQPCSVTHRFAQIPDVKEFFYNWKAGQYAHTKLANALFSKELNRHLQPHGVSSCAVDPGGVNSSIWDRGGPLSKPPLRTIISGLYAPPSDGASAVVHAASSQWKPTSPVCLSVTLCLSGIITMQDDHYFFARGMFASPLVTLNRCHTAMFILHLRPAVSEA